MSHIIKYVIIAAWKHRIHGIGVLSQCMYRELRPVSSHIVTCTSHELGRHCAGMVMTTNLELFSENVFGSLSISNYDFFSNIQEYLPIYACISR